MAVAQGVAKQTRFKRQSSKGTLAGTSLGQIVRRESSTFELAKETYDTASEITGKRQILSNRHGVRQVPGKITGIFSPGTYADFLAALLMRDFAAVTAITAASITIAGAGPTYTVTRAAGSFLTDGIKIGMGVRLTAGSFSAGNLNNNLFVLGVTATVLTVQTMNASALVAEGPIASSTVTISGKVTYVPTTGHTNVYYTVEEWYADIAQSERNLDVKALQAQLSLPGSGNAKADFTFTGLDQTTATSAYFTSPTAETTTEALVAASGILMVNGTQQGIVTDLSVTLDINGQPADGVVGSNIRPDVFTGKLKASGSLTVYFSDRVLSDVFLNESATSILCALTGGSANNADFVTLAMTQVNLNSATPDDGETGLKRTFNFVAEYNSSGGAALANQDTTFQIQDTQA